MEKNDPRILVRLLPAGLMLVAAGGLVWLGLRAIRAERVLAERTARTALAGRARETAARVAEMVAGLAREAAAGSGAAILAPDGTFLRPSAPRPLRRLREVQGRDPEGSFYLAVAGRAENEDGEPERAEELYRRAASPERDPLVRAVALHRLGALLLRRGRDDESEVVRRSFLAILSADDRRTVEGLVARARRPDAALEADLLAALGGGDDAVVRGLLAGLPESDGAARARRGAEIERMRALSRLLPPEGPRGAGARLADGRIVAWSVDGSGRVRVADGPLPATGPLVRILPAGVRAPDGGLVEVAAVSDLLPAVRVAASGSRDEAEADARRRILGLGGAMALLLVGGGAALVLTVRAVRREADAARERSRFLARVGHDLRTPLARIRLYAETMASGKVESPEEIREFSSVVQRDAERLSALVRTVLDLERLERAPRREDVDLREVVGEVARAHEPLLAEAAMRLDVSIPETPTPVSGDADALRGAVGNLIENALGHAAAGGLVEVSVVARPGWLDVVVADRGPGSPPSLGSRVFERFVRGPSAAAGGAGLGLAFVAEVARTHGGDVRVETRDGGGARFVMTLPRREETA